MSTDDDANVNVAPVSKQEVELYVANPVEWRDAHSELSQCCYRKYQHSWEHRYTNQISVLELTAV